MIRRPPRSPLFPYPTLFRSSGRRIRTSSSFRRPSAPGGRRARRKSRDSGSARQATTSRASVITPPMANAERHPKRSEEHTSELQSRLHLVCRLLLEKKKSHPRQADDPLPDTHHQVLTTPNPLAVRPEVTSARYAVACYGRGELYQSAHDPRPDSQV